MHPPILTTLQKLKSLFGMQDVSLSKTEKIRATALEVFSNSGTNSKMTLINIVGGQQMSIFGTYHMMNLLAQPSQQQSLTLKRQELVRLLYENEALFTQLDTMFSTMKQHESNILNFWTTQDPLVEELFEGYYYQWISSLNKFTIPLSARSITQDSGYALSVGGLPLTIAYSLFKAQNFLLTLWQYRSSLLTYLTAKYKDLDSSQKNLLALGLGATAFYFGIICFNYKMIYDRFQQDRKVFTYMQEQLISVAYMIDAVNTIVQIHSINPLFTSALPHLQESQSLLKQYGTRIASLLGKLQTNTFQGEPSYFSINGRIRATYKAMNQVKQELKPFFDLLGELESCFSIARMIKEINGKNHATQVCFTKFTNEGPYLKLENFWNPFVGADKAVVNSIKLGGVNNARNMLLTGSNTGGKSTTLKAMMVNALMAHCFGVCFASEATMSFFTYLGTSLNISDDTAGGNSLFKSEVLRAKSIENELKKLGSHASAFVIIDELFVGTAASVGEKAAFAFAEKLAREFPQAIIGFVTHFGLLTQLPEKTDGIFKNYKQDIWKDNNGKLVRSFLLEPGSSTQNVAVEIINEVDDLDKGDNKQL